MTGPFWNYYGGKWRAAPSYPPPRYGTIVEPFAGAAGYAMRYHDRHVILVDKYPVIAEIWRYLINADPAEILALPVDIEHVDALPDWTPLGLRYLVGFCMNTTCISPKKSLSTGAKRNRATGRAYEGWSTARARRVADQVPLIRHWQIIEGSYRDAPDVEATWYVDPPYQVAGCHYIHSDIDYTDLAVWCRSRRGQVIACEAVGATWLPFRPHREIKSFGKGGAFQMSAEAIWTNDAPSTAGTLAALIARGLIPRAA